jgi:hypothetical protein
MTIQLLLPHRRHRLLHRRHRLAATAAGAVEAGAICCSWWPCWRPALSGLRDDNCNHESVVACRRNMGRHEPGRIDEYVRPDILAGRPSPHRARRPGLPERKHTADRARPHLHEYPLPRTAETWATYIEARCDIVGFSFSGGSGHPRFGDSHGFRLRVPMPR